MNWFDRILDARWTGEFTSHDELDSMSYAGCLVGEFSPSKINGSYRKLGERFYKAVVEDDTESALDGLFQVGYYAM